MKILVTNDDGIFAPGIRALVQKLEVNHEVTVVAPDQERSAIGHAITIHHPLRAREMEFESIESRCIAVDGTPADCVKLAVESLLDQEIDLLISGINAGPNLGYDVLYSGTVSAAIEGLLVGLPSLAVSLATYEHWNFKPGAEFMADFITEYNQRELDSDTLLNINLPDPEESYNEVKVTKLGNMGYKNTFEQRVDPRGESYYWLVGEIQAGNDEETDLVAVDRGQVSVTPIELNLTAEDKIEQLKNWQLGE